MVLFFSNQAVGEVQYLNGDCTIDMKKLLILLTSVYPTSNGDMFVHEELKYLSSVFDRILLFPVNATGRQEAVVQLKDPVHLYLSNRRTALPARWRDFRFATHIRQWKNEEMLNERKTRVKNFKQLMYLGFVEGRARQVDRDTAPIIMQELSDGGYGEVVIYSYWMSTPARAALMIQDRLRRTYPLLTVRSYSRGHGYDIYDEAAASSYQPFRKALIERMNALFPCSDYGVNYMKERFVTPGSRDNIYCARLGVADPLKKRNLTVEDLILKRKGERNSLHVVSCSRVIELKRLPLLAKALSMLKGRGLDLKWTHFGDGPEFDQLKLFCDHNLSFMDYKLRGHVQHKDILDFYCYEAIDLFVNVSRTEGVPVSVMEAMAAALPIAATNVGGNGEIVKNEWGSVLWEAAITAEQIAASLAGIAERNPEERQRVARLSRLTWSRLSSSETNYKQMAQVLAGEVAAGDIPFLTGAKQADAEHSDQGN